MFGLGAGELLVLLVVALLFLGPEKLPDAAKSISKGIRDFRKHTRELQSTLEDDTQIGDAYRDLKSALRGDELRPYRPKTPPGKKVGPAAEGEAAAAAALADGEAGASDSATAGLSPTEARLAAESAAARPPASEPVPAAPGDGDGDDDDGLPLVRPAEGAVARSSVSPEPDPGPDDLPPDRDEDQKAHG